MAPKITLITGCSSGIGLATAVKLARDAAKGYVVYATMRNLAKRSELEKAAGQELNSTLFVLELDVTKHGTITAAVNTVIEKHGRLDILGEYQTILKLWYSMHAPPPPRLNNKCNIISVVKNQRHIRGTFFSGKYK